LHFCHDPVVVHVFLHQKFERDSLIQFNLHGW
jgi:hypothetical protein